MSSATPVLHTTLDHRSPDRQGKVRDIYEFGDRLLIVATDRISAFDYVLASGIPDKGKVLTQISAFWFERTRGIVDHHMLSLDPRSFPEPATRRGVDARRAFDAGEANRAVADRMRRAGISRRVGMEGLPRDRGGLRQRASRRPARVRSAAAPDLHARHQGRERTRHQHHARPRQASSSGLACSTASAISRCACTPRDPHTPRPAGSSSPTPSSNSGSSPIASCPTKIG